MKSIILIFCVLLLPAHPIFSQQPVKIYDDTLDGVTQLQTAIKRAAEDRKYVLLQIGGNWCSWCHKLHSLINSDDELKDFIDRNYVVVYLNYSKENKNEETLKLLGNPQRFGFPVLVILDEKGERLHTQDSALLESGKGHDKEKLFRFLQLWTPAAIQGTANQ